MTLDRHYGWLLVCCEHLRKLRVRNALAWPVNDGGRSRGAPPLLSATLPVRDCIAAGSRLCVDVREVHEVLGTSSRPRSSKRKTSLMNTLSLCQLISPLLFTRLPCESETLLVDELAWGARKHHCGLLALGNQCAIPHTESVCASKRCRGWLSAVERGTSAPLPWQFDLRPARIAFTISSLKSTDFSCTKLLRLLPPNLGANFCDLFIAAPHLYASFN